MYRGLESGLKRVLLAGSRAAILGVKARKCLMEINPRKVCTFQTQSMSAGLRRRSCSGGLGQGEDGEKRSKNM